MGMGAPARLDRRHLTRPMEIADVEDADAAHPLGAHRVLDALDAAVHTAARLLDRHDQQAAVHRHVTLAAGADDGGDEPRLPRDLDVVDVEAVEAADEREVAAER